MAGRIRTYTSQEQARSAGFLRANASPEAFGASIGRAVQGLGSALGGIGGALSAKAQKAETQARQRERAEAQITLAEMTGNSAVKFQEFQSAAEADGSGFTTEYLTWFDTTADEIIGNAKSDEQREQLELGLAKMRAVTQPRAIGWEATRAADYFKGKAQQGLDALTNTVLSDPSTYDLMWEQGDALVDSLPLKDPEVRENLRQGYRDGISQGYFQARSRQANTVEDVAALREELAQDKWKDRLTPSDYAAIQSDLRTTEVSIQKGERAAVKSRVDAVISRYEAGHEVSDAEVRDVFSQVAEHGDAATMDKFSTAMREREYSKVYKGKPREALVAEMEAGRQGRDTSVVIPQPARRVVDRFMNVHDLKDYQAAAIAGHLWHESGFDAANNTGDGGTAHGLAQWRGERFTRLKRFAAARGKSWTDFDTQLDYIMMEMQETPDGRLAYQRMQEATTLEEAVAAFMHFERPRGYSKKNPRAGLHFKERLARAEEAFRGGTPGNVAQFNAAERQLKAIDKGMNEDAVAFVMGDNPRFASEFDINTGEGIGARVQAMDEARQYYDNPDIGLLTKEEIDDISAGLEDANAATKGKYAATIVNELGAERAPEFFAELRDAEPQLFWAGNLLSKDRGATDTAMNILRGADYLKARDITAKKRFDEMDVDDERFPQDIATSLGAFPGELRHIQDAADHLYIHRTRNTGVFEAAAYRQAVVDVMGGVTVENVNGAPTVLPKGVDADMFERALDSLTDADLVERSVEGGAPVYINRVNADPIPLTADEVAEHGRFEAIGPDTYVVHVRDGYAADGNVLRGGATTIDQLRYKIRLDAEGVAELERRFVEDNASPLGAQRRQELMFEDIGEPIDPNKPIVPNEDGSLSTEQTITVKDGKTWVNVPTIVDGKKVSDAEAEDLYREGKNKSVGTFGTRRAAELSAEQRSAAIGNRIDNAFADAENEPTGLDRAAEARGFNSAKPARKPFDFKKAGIDLSPVIEAARRAIAAGVPRESVEERLKARDIDPKLLDE